jgi:hypothetical protein
MATKNYFDTPLTVARYLNEHWNDDARFIVMEKYLMEPRDGQKAFVFNMPPQTGKTAFAEAVMLWQAACNPKGSVLYVAHNLDAAMPMLGHLEGGMNAMGLSESKGFTTAAAGVLAPLSFDEATKFDYIIVESPVVTVLMAEDPEYVDKQWQWIQDLVKGHLAKKGTFVLMTSRYSSDDMTSKLITPASKGDSAFAKIPVRHVVFQMTASQDIKIGNKTYIKKDDLLSPGKDPKATMKALESLKEEFGDKYYNMFFQQIV